MALLKVARLGHPCLRSVTAPVDPHDIPSARIQRLVDDMIETMHEYDGIGLAAPQVHEPLRMVVYDAAAGTEPRPAEPSLRVLINPVLTPLGESMEEDWEGCLSLPDLRGKVPRYTRIRVEALDRQGLALSYTAKDFHARMVQHECDHLDGKVFLDRMRDMSSLMFLPEFLRYAGVESDVE